MKYGRSLSFRPVRLVPRDSDVAHQTACPVAKIAPVPSKTFERKMRHAEKNASEPLHFSRFLMS